MNTSGETLVEKLRQCVQAARAFGNETFAPVPIDIVEKVVSALTAKPQYHVDPTGLKREPPHCPSCSCGMPEPGILEAGQCIVRLGKDDEAMGE